MALLCRNEPETIDDFIDRKVLQLIEQSIVENKKKRKVKEKVHKNIARTSKKKYIILMLFQSCLNFQNTVAEECKITLLIFKVVFVTTVLLR